MKTIRSFAFAIMISAVTAFGLVQVFNAGLASAQPVATIDAGVAAIGSGSGAVATGSADPVKVVVAVSPPMPDPTADPTATLSTAEKLYKSGAFFALGIVVLFAGLYAADKYIAWLREGKRGVYIAAALGGLALLFVPATQGSTPTLAMFISAMSTAVALIINPSKPSPPASS